MLEEAPVLDRAHRLDEIEGQLAEADRAAIELSVARERRPVDGPEQRRRVARRGLQPRQIGQVPSVPSYRAGDRDADPDTGHQRPAGKPRHPAAARRTARGGIRLAAGFAVRAGADAASPLLRRAAPAAKLFRSAPCHPRPCPVREPDMRDAARGRNVTSRETPIPGKNKPLKGRRAGRYRIPGAIGAAGPAIPLSPHFAATMTEPVFPFGSSSVIRPLMLTLENIAYRVEGHLLFEGVSAQVGANRKFGLVGTQWLRQDHPASPHRGPARSR